LKPIGSHTEMHTMYSPCWNAVLPWAIRQG